MKKSVAVPATLIIAAAVSLTGVGCERPRDCVDANGRVVPDENCRASTGGVRGYHYIPRVSSGGFGSSSHTTFGG